ncbi:hypothetical protein NHX12_006661 [Muraenolepis orangiensis]|uniref:Uncharacterized protein n=1 Tax=Muraenolepis orangiensis TaxID=630683 RepID=A0A9Q0DQ46_9TELE|nr:hypothetical protein NHX12_006661 [Muraenolepis orangiensis]
MSSRRCWRGYEQPPLLAVGYEQPPLLAVGYEQPPLLLAVKIPAFTRGCCQLDENNVEEKRQMADLQVCVESGG